MCTYTLIYKSTSFPNFPYMLEVETSKEGFTDFYKLVETKGIVSVKLLIGEKSVLSWDKETQEIRMKGDVIDSTR
jgi:hypothetical protein